MLACVLVCEAIALTYFICLVPSIPIDVQSKDAAIYVQPHTKYEFSVGLHSEASLQW